MACLALGFGVNVAATAHAAVGQAAVSEKDEVEAARNVLKRLGVDDAKIQLRTIPGDEAAYRVRVSNGRVSVDGTSPIALTKGVAKYLGDNGALHVSWEGVRVRPLRAVGNFDSGLVTSPFGLRSYLNVCAYGYTTPWWDWSRWEREIDWMAVRGIDTPIAMEGQEYVWRALWREEGLTEAEIASGMSAAPFLPWQRMGNIAGYRSPLSAEWIDKKHALQLRILERMRSLGMKPILPGFSGYVPKAFADRHPNAKIYQMRTWGEFAGTYWVDPSDPLFAKLAKRFIEIYNATYGKGEYYLVDAFNEMIPPMEDHAESRNGAAKEGIGGNEAAATPGAKADHPVVPASVRDARLGAYGEHLYRSIAVAAPDATWVMQGWMFGYDAEFWTPDAVAAFLSRVPADRTLILDIGNDRYSDVWKTNNAFAGKGWIYGYVHNYGGSNPVYGDPKFYRSDMQAVLKDPARGRLAGFGIYPEGINNNSLVYDYTYDLAWGDLKADGSARPFDEWLSSYLRSRYGQATPAVEAAWKNVVTGTYSTKYWTPRWWNKRGGVYLFFKRPTHDMTGIEPSPGDQAALAKGIEALLTQAPNYAREPLYRYDLIEFVRHYSTLVLDDQIKRAAAAYNRGDIAAGDRAVAAITRLATELDGVMGAQQETLGSWLQDASDYGATPADKRKYVADAKKIVTQWDPSAGLLSDYAGRAWQGLYAGYYLPRWTMLLKARRDAAVAKTPFDAAATVAKMKAWENRWIDDAEMWPRRQLQDPLSAAAKVFAYAHELDGSTR